MADPVISLSKVTKRFGPVWANREVDLDLFPGRVHALLGENGAGKSTLMSILAGRYSADGGTMMMHGREVSFNSPAKALDHGIGMVYQRFMLIESMTVSENLALSAGKAHGRTGIDQVIHQTAERYGLGVDPEKRVFELSMGERQRVEIIKLLMLDAEVLIFDEPTSVLTPPEVDALFEVIDQLRAEGKTIVLITHKLEEVLKLADDISIMRKGRLVFSERIDARQMSRQQLARLMVGRDVVLRVDKKEVAVGETILALQGVSGDSPLGGPSYTDVTLEIKQGEIFSIIGVAGNGQVGLVSAITGLSQARSGTITFDGATYNAREWRMASREKIAYVPEDRYHSGSIGAMSIADNFALTRLAAYRSGMAGMVLDREKMAADGTRAIRDHNIKVESSEDSAGSLSGGNLQKVILARELTRNAKLFVAEQPTQGLDISATEEIWRALLECREKAAVLLVTGDLKEVLSLSDRIGVIFNGRILEIIDAHDSDQVDRVGLLMAGVRT
ncbi:MAG: ABC transporter ATP-binding protein [Desulfofustis sp.]|nr:ABC transporter ATP-binding protein [Desulfofustis sp.]